MNDIFMSNSDLSVMNSLPEKFPNRVQIHENENTDQTKLHIWILFTQWLVLWNPKTDDRTYDQSLPLPVFPKIIQRYTEWKLSKYGYFSVPYFSTFGLNAVRIFSVRIQENADQKTLRIWTLFTQWYYLNRCLIISKQLRFFYYGLPIYQLKT